MSRAKARPSPFKAKYERTKALLSKANKRARAIGSGAKPLAVGAGVGAVAQLATKFAGDKVDFIANNWFGDGAVMMVGALAVRKKNPAASIALAGAAGYALAFNYQLKKSQEGEGESPVRQFQEATDTQGFLGSGWGSDTGLVIDPRRRHTPAFAPVVETAGWDTAGLDEPMTVYTGGDAAMI